VFPYAIIGVNLYVRKQFICTFIRVTPRRPAEMYGSTECDLKSNAI